MDSTRRDYFRGQREWISLRSKVWSLNRKENPKQSFQNFFNVKRRVLNFGFFSLYL